MKNKQIHLKLFNNYNFINIMNLYIIYEFSYRFRTGSSKFEKFESFYYFMGNINNIK